MPLKAKKIATCKFIEIRKYGHIQIISCQYMYVEIASSDWKGKQWPDQGGPVLHKPGS